MSTTTSDHDHRARLKDALLALQRMQTRIDALERGRQGPIAVVGLGCRFPGGANGPSRLWQMLCQGHDAVTEVPPSRWRIDDVYDADPDAPGRMYARHGAFLSDIDRFDAPFFGITPREAVKMDPQHRLLLEVAWEALEHAGVPPDSLTTTRTGVFVGITASDYETLCSNNGFGSIDAYNLTGSCLNFAAGRLSYALGLQGPAMAVDTACSSSLVAVHLACQSLRLGECTFALAGGVNAILSPVRSIAACKARMLSPTGRAKTFDADADGFVRGEGCGVVVLRRLEDAIGHGQPILAVIRGTAVNQDGPASGLTVPNGLAQESLIQDALARAGASAKDIDYVEAHGTGTALGDPIELRALAAVLGKDRTGRPLLVGSIKTNIGHLESAAGIAGLIKTVLALQHGAIPPHLHFRRPNPRADWARMPITVPTAMTPWPTAPRPRRAGVSSFGASGTNAHVVLEEGPANRTCAESADRPAHVLTLAARSDAALLELARRMDAVAATDTSLGDLCFSANTGRAQLPHRAAITATTPDDLRTKLEALVAGRASAGVTRTRVPSTGPPRIAFLFTGQGSQCLGMGRQLYDTEPVFRAALDRCAAILKPELDTPLLDVMFGDNAATNRLQQTAFAQPALFAMEWALAELWKSAGVVPSAVLGHSLGEYVAACRAGVFTLDEALPLVAVRGRLMQQLPGGGAMAAVFENARVVEDLIQSLRVRVSIAAVNGPNNTTVSGPASEVAVLCAALIDGGIETKPLDVSHAFHSVLLDPILDIFESHAARLTYAEPRIAVVSNLTGARASAADLVNASYWRRHARERVQFEAGVRCLVDEGYELFVEIGPAATLSSLARSCAPAGHGVWLSSMRHGAGEAQQFVSALGAAWAHGISVDWRAFDRDRPRRHVPLPTYPFEEHRYWLPSGQGSVATPFGTHPLIGARLNAPPMAGTVYQANWSAATLPFLDDHRVYGMRVVPATAVIETLLAAGRAELGPLPVDLERVSWHRPLVIGDGEELVVQTSLSPAPDGGWDCRIFSAHPSEQPAAWTLHASAVMRRGGPRAAPSDRAEPAESDSVPAVAASVAHHYDRLAGSGVELGPAFRGIARLDVGPTIAIAEVHPPESITVTAYGIHPAVLDACFQSVAPLLPATDSSAAYVPAAIDRFWAAASLSYPVWAHGSIRSGHGSADQIVADVLIVDRTGLVMASVTGLHLQRVTRASFGHGSEMPWRYAVEWQPKQRAATAGTSIAQTSPTLSGWNTDAVEAAMTREVSSIDEAVLPALEHLSTIYIRRALNDLGWRPQRGDTVAANTFVERRGVQPRYGRFIHRMLEMLEEDEFLAPGEAGWTVTRPPADITPESTETQLAASPECTTELALISRVGRGLAAALRGDTDPLQLLFPDGSLVHAERLYADSFLLRCHNAAVHALVASEVERRASNQPIRILELGGGTGGTTAGLLSVLPADRIQYTFSDISPAFLAHAKKKFAGWPSVRYRLLDIEQQPAPEDFAAFDIIVAANVLHATADVAETLQHVHRLLAPSGCLVLLEPNKRLRLADLVVGLTDGWWKFTDTERRPTHALLPASAWKQVLRTHGYDDVQVFPEDPQGNGALVCHCVIAARRGHAALPTLTESAAEEKWLVLADEAGLGDLVAGRLAARGCAPFVVAHGRQYQRRASGHYEIDAANREHYTRLLRDVCATGPIRGIVHLWSLDIPMPAKLADNAFDRAQLLGTGAALHVVQALVSVHESATPRLCIVTRGSQPTDTSAPVAVAQAPVWGFGASLALEQPELHAIIVDLDPMALDMEQSADDLCSELLDPDGENQIALRARRRLVRRLVTDTRPSGETTEADAVGLEIGAHGTIDGLAFRRVERRPPGPGEVEIEVDATGLNFRDVLRSLHAYPGDPGDSLGSECAGRVTRVGAGVDSLTIGDEVIALAAGAFGTYAVARAALTARRPQSLSVEEGASVPAAFVTASHALETLARLEAGERVLIHAGAGGVGLAAVQIARHLGAEVFATAGTAAKRSFLRSWGVSHVFDSRSTTFSRDVLDATDGAGVDVVLNSLSGEAIGASLTCLTPSGRFVEIGRRDIWTAAQVAAVRPGVTYLVVDLAELLSHSPSVGSEALTRVLARIAAGALEPLPVTQFGVDEVHAAFRYVAEGRHVGKVVVSRRHEGVRTTSIHPGATYLIVGGLNGVGLRVAQWLIEAGADHLVLMGRSAPGSAAIDAIAVMRASGAAIEIVRGDVSNPADVLTAVTVADAADAPLRGIVQSAGVLDDGVVEHQDWQRFRRVLTPKVDGSWNLVALTIGKPLDFFVMFSSAVSLLGSAGQTSHAAACAFQDALAAHAVRQGIPAMCINWGPWAEIGSVVRENAGQRLQTRGLRLIAPNRAVDMLASVFRDGRTQCVAINADWDRYVTQFAAGQAPPLLTGLHRHGTAARNQELSRWQARPAVTPADGPERIRALVYDHIVAVLGLRSSEVLEGDRGLRDLGVDSLMSLELRNRLQGSLGVSLPSTLAFDYPTPSALVDFVAGIACTFANDTTGGEHRDRVAPTTDLDELTDEQAEAVLINELRSEPAVGRV